MDGVGLEAEQHALIWNTSICAKFKYNKLHIRPKRKSWKSDFN